MQEKPSEQQVQELKSRILQLVQKLSFVEGLEYPDGDQWLEYQEATELKEALKQWRELLSIST